MKISTLIKREPFERIFENTLKSYLKDSTGNNYDVIWNSYRKDSKQMWYCNPHINSIFVKDVRKAVFDSIIGEYKSNPLKPWKALFQNVYTYFSTNRYTSKILSSYSVSINPPIENAKNKLIIGGNNKIRIIDIQKKMVHVLLKQGFDKDFLTKEIHIRNKFPFLSTTKILEVSRNETWYCEDYVTGIPPNRLDELKGRKIMFEAIHQLHTLYSNTKRITLSSMYVSQIGEKASKNLNNIDFINVKTKENLKKIIKFIISFFEDNNEETTLAFSHGDFHPGNILCSEKIFWIMDWEHSGEKHISYDLIIMLLETRMDDGYSKRLINLLDNKVSLNKRNFVSIWPNIDWNDDNKRKEYVLKFMLEDLLFYLKENDNAVFFKNSSCLDSRCKEMMKVISYIT